MQEVYYIQGRYQEAESLYKDALQIVVKALGEAHPNTAIICDNFADLYNAMGRKEEAEEWTRRAAASRAAHEDQ